MAVTLGIYYLTPWLRWDRGPYAPDQAVLVDLANRRFYFFFIEIWPQEFYYVAGLLIMAGLGLFLVTSAVGRAWCGYTCPQTVWVDLFLVVERWIEGDRNARIKLDAAPWSLRQARQARRPSTRSGCVIAVATGGAWIFYFADAPTLLVDLVTGSGRAGRLHHRRHPDRHDLRLRRLHARAGLHLHVPLAAHPGGHARRGFADRHLQRLARRAALAPCQEGGCAEGQPVGDCVDCNACVAVCPMGIDIRDGQQLECITCALCIDACDGVMDKLGRERGLISYATLADYNANMAVATAGGTLPLDPARVRNPEGRLRAGLAHVGWRKLVRPRTLVYFGAWSLVGLLLLYGLLVARPARGERPARPQPAVRRAVGRLHPQRLHGQAAQQDPRAAHHHRHAAGSARRGDERRRSQPARRSLLRRRAPSPIG